MLLGGQTEDIIYSEEGGFKRPELIYKKKILDQLRAAEYSFKYLG